MAVIAAVLFALAALGGVVLAVQRLRGRERPSGAIAVAHGLVAATALVLLLIAVIGADDPSGLAVTALVLFIVVALGGFGLASFHLRGRALPIPLMVAHGAGAVIAFGLLLAALVGDPDLAAAP